MFDVVAVVEISSFACGRNKRCWGEHDVATQVVQEVVARVVPSTEKPSF